MQTHSLYADEVYFVRADPVSSKLPFPDALSTLGPKLVDLVACDGPANLVLYIGRKRGG